VTAKEIQLYFIKNYLKPILKTYGYKTLGQTWWKDKGEFYTLINLQNYSWNSKNSVDFCFNIGIAFKKESIIKSPSVHNLDVYLREGFYLPNQRKEYLYRNKSGYTLTNGVNKENFESEIKIDFEKYILPYLENLKTIKDCVDCFGQIPFWGENLKKVVADNNLQ